MAAIFVADRETIQKVFDGREADALKIGRTPGPDALQELEWSLEIVGQGGTVNPER